MHRSSSLTPKRASKKMPLGRHIRWLSRLKTESYRERSLLLFFSTAAPTRPDPPPIRVALTESAGRGVFATRKISAGQLIHTAKPIASYPSFADRNRVCYLCLKRLKSFDESQKQSVSFCSEECRHDSEVNFYGVEKQVDFSSFDDYCWTNGMKYPLLVKRLACIVASQAASPDILDIFQPSNLSQEMILKMEEGFSLLRKAFTEANIRDEYIAFLTKQWYASVLARIHINSFRIELAGGSYEDLLSLAAASVEAGAAVGNAIYMLPSFYNHDCDPNVHIVWLESSDAKLMTLREVEEGEELRICYIDTSMSYEARQTILSRGFGFQCNCFRCMSGD